MADKYVINWTDESLKGPFSVNPNTTDERTTSLTLVGAGAMEWGSEYQENFLHLLENFASNNKPPLSPTIGQTWFNAATGYLSIFSPDSTWMDVKRRRIDSNKAPIGHYAPGDLWFDTGNNQLKVFLSDGTWSDPMSGTQVSRPNGGVPAPTTPITPTPATPTAPTPLPPGTPTPTPVSPVVPTPGISVEPPFPSSVFPFGQPSTLYPMMTLNENFNGVSLDANKWNVGLWYDGNNNLNNYAVENGTLIAWPKKTGQGLWDPHNFTVTTDDKFYQKYGFFEARIKLPFGSGMCPTFWLYAHNDSTRPDITAMASFPGAVNIYSDSTRHPRNYVASVTDAAVNKLGERKLLGSLYNTLATAPDLSLDFHIYGVRWDASGIQFYFDGQPLGSKINTTALNQRMFLVLDLWLGGDSGAADANTPLTKDRGMVVDYVRAWALNDGSSEVSGTYTIPPNLPVPTPTAVPTVPTPVAQISATNLNPVLKVTGLAKPWALAFLSTTKILVTEKTGPTMRIVNLLNGSKSAPLTGLPSVLITKHGGLLDVILDSSFDATRIIYFTYTSGTATANAITVSKARLSNDETALENVTQIFQASPFVNSGDQPAGRIVERPDGTLMLTCGDRYVMDTQAQVLTNNFGKVVRFKKDGTVPADNPYANASNAAQKYVFSYGHRNPLGAMNGPDGNLWVHENMAEGGDEINIVKPTLNYGWPIQSYGSHYDDGHVPKEIPDTAPGVELPIFFWNPSIAPSGMCLIDSNIYGPDWKGNLVLGALIGTSVRRFSINGLKNDVVQETIYLQSFAKRIRDIRQGPDGYLYVCTDEDNGGIYQLAPVFPSPAPVPAPIGSVPTPTVTPGAVLPFGQSGNYTLSFQDEFNSGLDFSKWNDHIWYEQSGSLINYKVQNGSLFVWPDNGFVNRTIDTDGKFSQTYGFYEIEAKLPIGVGCWPAFWLYAHPDAGNKSRPEIDIMEAYPGGGPSSGWSTADLHPNNYGLTVHKANADYSYHEVAFSKKLSDFGISADLSAGFHKYGMKWEADGITFYFDGQPLGSKWIDTAHYFDQPMYVLLDLWFGSASGQPGSGTPTGIANSFEIRYVRVWKFSGTTAPTPVPTFTPTPTVAPTPVPVSGTLIIDYYGDSTIWGTNGAGGGRVATPQPQVFSNSLAASSPPWVNTTRNEGVSATNSTQLLNGTDGVHPAWTTQMTTTAAKYIIINHGINDWMNNSTVYKSNLQQLITIAKSKGKTVLLQTPNPTFQSLSGGSSASDVEVANKAQYMREVGFAQNVSVIDVHQFVSSLGSSIQSLIPDGLHPSQSVYNQIGAFAATEFKRLLGLSSTVPTPTPTFTPTPAAPAGNAPSMAAAAGYNSRVFFDDFNNPANIGTNGPVWWTKRPFYPDLTSGEYSVSNSILQMRQGTNFSNFGLCTVGPGGVGFAKRNGGYFEARIRIIGRGRSSGWTSFWTMAVEHLYGPAQDFIEVDFLEDLGPAFGWSSNNIAQVVHEYTGGNFANPSSSYGPQVPMVSGFNFSDWHVYGCLWKPNNSITWFVDGRQTSQRTYTTAGTYGSADSNGWPLILGSGGGADFDCDWVSVWG